MVIVHRRASRTSIHSRSGRESRTVALACAFAHLNSGFEVAPLLASLVGPDPKSADTNIVTWNVHERDLR
jgi:hypothetical protein